MQLIPNLLYYNRLNAINFYVECNGIKSSIYKIKAGVPQGCILSPVLFSIYFSDISNEINIPHALYADDLSIWDADTKKIKVQESLQDNINKISNFCSKWCLKLNKTKSSYTSFTNAGKRNAYEKLHSLDLKLYNSKIPLEPYSKFLGITFDPKLSFNKEAVCITE
jgi:hypothetical protein